MSAHHVARDVPRLFRTYIDGTGANESYDCAIWQAARATSAFPALFKPIKIGPPGLMEPHIDGGLGCNNPLDILFEEAYRNWPERHVSCIVSLGAGQSHPVSFISADLKNALLEITLDCESTANEAELHFREAPDVYFRFSVSQGMQAIDRFDWDQVDTIHSSTVRYLLSEPVTEKFADAVKVVGTRQLGKISTARLSVCY